MKGGRGGGGGRGVREGGEREEEVNIKRKRISTKKGLGLSDFQGVEGGGRRQSFSKVSTPRFTGNDGGPVKKCV